MVGQWLYGITEKGEGYISLVEKWIDGVNLSNPLKLKFLYAKDGDCDENTTEQGEWGPSILMPALIISKIYYPISILL